MSNEFNKKKIIYENFIHHENTINYKDIVYLNLKFHHIAFNFNLDYFKIHKFTEVKNFELVKVEKENNETKEVVISVLYFLLTLKDGTNEEWYFDTPISKNTKDTNNLLNSLNSILINVRKILGLKENEEKKEETPKAKIKSDEEIKAETTNNKVIIEDNKKFTPTQETKVEEKEEATPTITTSTPIQPLNKVELNEPIKKETNNNYCGADKILKYKSLMDQGIITKDEFEAKKKQILAEDD